MLANLLPGVREIRAALAAGYVLLLALWMLVADLVPSRTDAGPVLLPVYRAAGLISVTGWALALSFAAYLLGSLATMVFGGVARRVLEPTPRPRRHLDALTPRSRAALALAADSHRQRFEAGLTFTDTQLDDVLYDQPLPLVTAAEGGEHPEGPGAAVVENDHAVRQRLRIESLIREDLELLARTRLLGDKPDLYAAADRGHSEVEFRAALVVPSLALGLALGARSSNPQALLWLVGSGAVAAALMLDALRHQRLAIGLLVDLVATDRVAVPSLERCEQRVRQAAQSDLTAARRVSERVDETLRAAFRSLDAVGTSEPALAAEARRRVGEARGAGEQFLTGFPSDAPFAPLRQTLDLLEQAADGWVALNDGRPHTDPRDATARARNAWLSFLSSVRQALRDLTAVGTQASPGERPSPPEPP